MVRLLPLEPLNAQAFSPFGEVIDASTSCEKYLINEGNTQRHHALATVDCSRDDGVAVLSLFRAQAIRPDFVLQGMERHPLGSQAFINTSGNRFAIVVAPPGDLQEAAIQGFWASGSQSISYHRGTWHHFLLALDAASDFVVVDRIGPGNNCHEINLEAPLRLALPQ